MALQMNSAEERVDFILAEGPFSLEELNSLAPHVIEDYMLTADAHLQQVGPEGFREAKDRFRDYAENWIFQEKWEMFPGV